MLPLDVESDKANPQTSTVQMVSEHMNDMVIAKAIARAIRGIPGVLDMGQGLFAKAATYGPRKHIVGIVLRRVALEDLAVEVHVILDEVTFINTLLDATSSSGNTPILLHFADLIRVVVSQTFGHLGLPTPTIVDVTIDDIR